MKVFIADDSIVIRERLIEMISEIEGIEVIGEAGTAAEAVPLIIKLKPSVVILDIRMPGGNGISVLETIRKTNLNMKVIMLTNYPYPQYRQKCKEAGADFFFDKDTEFKKVSNTLKILAEKACNNTEETA
jgi:DNA-binding NarL/FixJ family response regulator